MTDHLLTFVHISDTHIPTDPAYRTEDATIPPYEGALKLVEQLNNLPFEPDFVLHTGDVAYDPDPEAYANCKDILSGIPYAIYYVTGNHDSSAALQMVMMGKQTPMTQLHYTFDVNGVQFVVVDSNGPAEQPRGFMTDSQLAWLETICCDTDDTRPLVIATHHNPIPVGIPWLDDFMGIQNGEAFHRTIYPARERIRGVFFGHIHQNLDIYRDGIYYCSTLSPWLNLHAWPEQVDTVPDVGAEGGFSVVTISSKQTTVRRHHFRLTG
jgi:3',5'-cyclic-AMP phosphodiesterase